MRTEFLSFNYFRKVSREVPVGAEEETISADKRQHPIDSLKVFLFVLSLVILGCSISVPFLFRGDDSSVFGAVTYLLYGLYPIQIVTVVIGLIGRKIRFREYVYHWLALLIQLVVTAAAYAFVFYKIADALSGF